MEPMAGSRPFGLVLVLLGFVLVAVGVLYWLGALDWLGRLPGDVRIERPGFRLYFPLTTMLLVSVALTVVLNLLRRFLG